MPRPMKNRRVCREPEYTGFLPNGIAAGADVVLTVDEYEVIRLVDLDKKTHVQTAQQMGISKTTVTEIYESAREKIADALVNGKRLYITGGKYQVCEAASFCNRRGTCTSRNYSGTKPPEWKTKEEHSMRIAVTYENGEIFQHFGHTQQFKVYDVEDNKVVNTQIVDTNGQGHGALATFLSQGQVDVLICGGIGGGAQNALQEAGIQLFGGAHGNADEAVAALLSGSLNYNPDVQCNHHGHGHGEGRGCGGHGGNCGSH